MFRCLQPMRRVALAALFLLALPIGAQENRNIRFGKPIPQVNAADANDDIPIACDQYVMSYNSKKKLPNWVSWHLTKKDIGDATRGAWEPDERLPKDSVRVVDSTYDKCGFDRGHMCPSEDRSSTEEDNDVTFILTNAIPQSPNNNRKGWRMLEAYCQKLALDGNDLHIVCGPHGQRGEGTLGFANFITHAKIKVTVPSATWKAILVLPDAKKEPTKRTRTIAVIMPNDQSVTTDWAKHRCSIEEVEELTGYKIFPTIQDSVAGIIKKRVDDEPIKTKASKKARKKKKMSGEDE